MEEQRQRQEEEARRTVSATSNESAGQNPTDGMLYCLTDFYA